MQGECQITLSTNQSHSLAIESYTQLHQSTCIKATMRFYGINKGGVGYK